MKNTVINGTGNSYKLKTIANILSAYHTYEDFAVAFATGEITADILLNPPGIQQQGMALNKENLLSDATATALGLTGDPTPNDALAKAAELISNLDSGLDVTDGRLMAAAAPFRAYDYFLESGTWTPPADMDGDEVFVVAVSGGGGGAGGGAGGGKITLPTGVSGTAVGGGGGGGAGGTGGNGHLVTGVAKVTKGVAYPVTVGAGGTGGNGGTAVAGGNGNAGSNGGDGGVSSFLTVVAPGAGGGKGGKGGKIGTAGTATKGGNGGAGGDGGNGGDGICGGHGGGGGAGGAGGYLSSDANAGGTGGKGGKGGNGGNGYGSLANPEYSQTGESGESGSTATASYNSGLGGKGGNGGYGKSGIDAKYGPQFLYPILISSLRLYRIGGTSGTIGLGGSSYASNANNRVAYGGNPGNRTSHIYFYILPGNNDVAVNSTLSNQGLSDFYSIAMGGVGGGGGNSYASPAITSPQKGNDGSKGQDGTGGMVIIFYNRRMSKPV